MINDLPEIKDVPSVSLIKVSYSFSVEPTKWILINSETSTLSNKSFAIVGPSCPKEI